MKKLTLVCILVFVIQTNLLSQSCLPDGITFSTQTEIDNFPSNYPNCSEIEGDVLMDGLDITNLDSLAVLTSIGGNLNIGEYNIDNLISISGLNNLTSIGGNLAFSWAGNLLNLNGLDNLSSIGGQLSVNGCFSLIDIENLSNLTSVGTYVSITLNNSLTNLNGLDGLTFIQSDLIIKWNDSLTSLTGLNNINSIDGALILHDNDALINMEGLNNVNHIGGELSISNNYGLINMAGLNNLNSIGGELNVSDNLGLKNMTGLDNLTSIQGELSIYHNKNLTELHGLDSLTSIENRIEIVGNDSLKNLSGIHSIVPGSITRLTIANNTSLSDCEVQVVCEYLSDPAGVIRIHDNANGCNNPAQIASSCGFLISCLPYGNYYFHSQADIDSFQYYYPDCSDLEGYVEISGVDIKSLSGLIQITSIGEGGLHIGSNDSLVNLTGLDSIKSIAGDLLIGEYFSYSTNPSLTSLAGLNGLVSIEGGLYILANDVLVNLNGLNNVVTIGGWLELGRNSSLSSLTGIDKIEGNAIEHLIINSNPILSSCDVQSICDYLVAPSGVVSIEDNAVGCNSQLEIEEACSQPCLSDGITFDTQAEINSFQTDNPNCSEIGGDVIISGDNITNLNGLNVITMIMGRLIIVDADSLSDLSGLNNLTSVGSDFEIIYCDDLVSLNGLAHLASINGRLSIYGNERLINLMGLDNLTSIGEQLQIGKDIPLGGNPDLNSLNGFENLTSVGGSLIIQHNPALRDLNGLDNLGSIGDSIVIGDLVGLNNDSLSSLSGLNNIDANTITNLLIYNNPSLESCQAKSICDYLSVPNGNIEIYNNAPGCNSQQEVEKACEVNWISDIINIDFFFYPNPATEELLITNNKNLKIETVNIYNQLGQKILQQKQKTNKIDISILEQGLYIIEVVSSEMKFREKLIIK